MKRKELVKELQRAGCLLLPPGARHDIYINPKNGMKQPVPRHSEIDNTSQGTFENILCSSSPNRSLKLTVANVHEDPVGSKDAGAPAAYPQR